MQLTSENFEQVLQSSMQKPLFCLFYVDQPECDAAKKALTTAISDNNEFVTLALCNVQNEMVQYLAAQLGLMNTPSLVVIDKGQPAAMMEGKEIVENLQEVLNQFMPSQGEMVMREALQAEAAGDLHTACTKAAQAYGQDPQNQSFKFIYARLLIALKNTHKAHELLDNAGREEQSMPEYQQLISALSLAEQAQNSPALLELKDKYEQEPSDENAIAYAAALADAGEKEEALVLLFAKLKEDLNKAEIKKTFLDILSTMDGDKMQSYYRRKLYTLMY